MNDLLQNIQDWHANVCRKCNAPCKMRRKILNAGHFLVFQFDVWDPTSKIRRKGNINCVPTASLKIGTSLYKPKASIHLEKSKTPGMTYVCIVSTSGKWLYCNNVELSVVHWPKGARDMYMLFFEQTTTDSTTRKTPLKRDIKLDNAHVNPVKHKLCDEKQSSWKKMPFYNRGLCPNWL